MCNLYSVVINVRPSAASVLAFQVGRLHLLAQRHDGLGVHPDKRVTVASMLPTCLAETGGLKR